MEKARQLLILYATETGNALDAAERLGREAETRGCPVRLFSLDEFHPVSFYSSKLLLLFRNLVTSCLTISSTFMTLLQSSSV